MFVPNMVLLHPGKTHLVTAVHRKPSPPPASFSSSSMLVLMVSYSESMLWPPLIRLRASRASWLRPFWISQRGLSGRKKKPMNCSTAGTMDKPSMYLQYGGNEEEWRGEGMLPLDQWDSQSGGLNTFKCHGGGRFQAASSWIGESKTHNWGCSERIHMTEIWVNILDSNPSVWPFFKDQLYLFKTRSTWDPLLAHNWKILFLVRSDWQFNCSLIHIAIYLRSGVKEEFQQLSSVVCTMLVRWDRYTLISIKSAFYKSCIMSCTIVCVIAVIEVLLLLC